MARISSRLDQMGSAIFSEMDRLKKEKEKEGTSIINLSIGSPDLPPAPHIREALEREVLLGNNYGYSLTEGLFQLKEAIADWYKRRFQVDLDEETEVLPLIGSQDGLGHIGLAYLDPGDIALVPDPGYPVYSASVALAGGKKYPLPLVQENNFLPDLQVIPEKIAQNAKIMFLNYPNHPVAATADHAFYPSCGFCRRYDLLLCHDLAYSELAMMVISRPACWRCPVPRRLR